MMSNDIDLPEDIDIYENEVDRVQTSYVDVDSFLDEFFVAKMRVVALERDNAELKGKIENLLRWKEQIEQVMIDDTMNTISEKKEKRPRQKTDEQVCFLNFCEAYKKDTTILARVSSKVASLGYGGVRRVPWSILKLELRTMYEKLSEDDKIKYLNKARDS
jgi:hypothetical protein